MSRQYDAWEHSQLEPEEKLITGNAKKHKPIFAEKNKLYEEMRQRMGEEWMAEQERRWKEKMQARKDNGWWED